MNIRKRITTLILLLSCLVVGLTQCGLSDVRTDYIKKGLQEQDYEKGKAVLAKMETAYGGKDKWLSQETATYTQTADWYGKLKVSGWDTVPQSFQMQTQLGTTEGSLTLLNGKNKGTQWQFEKDKSNSIAPDGSISPLSSRAIEKIVFKNYWFQFPFRIGEAEIIAYAGEATIQNEPYHLVFATWGSLKPNADYDQFLLYIHQDTYRLEYAEFTARDLNRMMKPVTHFDDFKTVDGFTLPHIQYVWLGSPDKPKVRLHENRYDKVMLKDTNALNPSFNN